MSFKSKMSSKKVEQIDIDDVDSKEIQKWFFKDPTCFICNGYNGPCFGEPICSDCHEFLYPNAAPDIRILTHLTDQSSEDSDSGNDEPGVAAVKPCEDVENSGETIPVEGDSLEECPPPVPLSTALLSVEFLPAEVLMQVFTYLDEISLWSVGEVCKRWKEILKLYFKGPDWEAVVKQRWPLLEFEDTEQDWYEVYSGLIESCWCVKCIRQMAAQEEPPGEENSWRKHRLRTELRCMRMDPLDGIQAEPLDPLYCHWQATIQGPIGSPYEGGVFVLYIQIPYTYPMCPPLVRFLTKIFHPNISRHGDVGLDCINHNWSLALTLSKVLISVQSLLTDPFCDVCMEPDVGRLYLDRRELFEKEARKWTWKYAMHDIILH